MNEFMNEAIKEAFLGLRNGDGGPFGAVIVKDGKIIARGHNKVVGTNDPTAHAEVTVIREASKKLGRFDLSDCEIYSSCEPCPMCLSAIYWAKIKKLYYGCTQKDAAGIGFDDKFIYDIIKGKTSVNKITSAQIDRKECLVPFKEWQKKDDRVQY